MDFGRFSRLRGPRGERALIRGRAPPAAGTSNNSHIRRLPKEDEHETQFDRSRLMTRPLLRRRPAAAEPTVKRECVVPHVQHSCRAPRPERRTTSAEHRTVPHGRGMPRTARSTSAHQTSLSTSRPKPLPVRRGHLTSARHLGSRDLGLPRTARARRRGVDLPLQVQAEHRPKPLVSRAAGTSPIGRPDGQPVTTPPEAVVEGPGAQAPGSS